MTDEKGNICGEISKLEEKVVYAISRLQNGKTKKGKRSKVTGVSNQQIVDYLNANYRYLDGDIESQVTTALLSCVKTGIVCLLNNGRFRLVGLNSKSMFSNCMTRTSHGTNCKCISIINLMSKIYPNPCCSLKYKKKSQQCSINKILRKSQRRRSRSQKRNKSKQNNTKQAKQSPRRCRYYASPSLDVFDMDSKAVIAGKCQNCNQNDSMITRERVKKNVSSCLFQNLFSPSHKLSTTEDLK